MFPVDNQTYSYHCFYFDLSSKPAAKEINVSFTFSETNPDLYFELDDVTLNSTGANLIANGDFEDRDYLGEWNVQSCELCDPGVDDLDPNTGDYSFYSSGVNVTLSQAVQLNETNITFNVFYLGFWMAFECGGNNRCSLDVNLLAV